MLLIAQPSYSEEVVNFYNWSDYIGENTIETVSYTHLTLPTILLV